MNTSFTSGGLIVRHFYIDEAGIGNPDIEPYTVVAGIVLHVDAQYDMLQRYLLDMADDLVAPNDERPVNFGFHAKELWHGNGFFPRDKWTFEKRMEILNHLADIPAKLDLPIIYSCLERNLFSPDVKTKAERRAADKKSHTTCFLSALNTANKWMQQSFPEEKIFAVVENHQKHRSGMQIVAENLSDPRWREEIEKDPDFRWGPLTHFVETPLFSPKSGSSPLQIADICAFILAKALGGHNHSEGLLKKIEPQLVTGFRKDFFRLAGDEESS